MRRFNPAEAEEGFSSNQIANNEKQVLIPVSIQPKPKKGLVAMWILTPELEKALGFNPAEAEEGFSSDIKTE